MTKQKHTQVWPARKETGGTCLGPILVLSLARRLPGNRNRIVSSDMANLWNTLVPAVTCNSTMMLKQMVMAGQGLAFLSKVAFLEEIANGTVVWRTFAAGMSGTQHTAVAISSLRVLSPVTRNFVQRLI